MRCELAGSEGNFDQFEASAVWSWVWWHHWHFSVLLVEPSILMSKLHMDSKTPRQHVNMSTPRV